MPILDVEVVGEVADGGSLPRRIAEAASAALFSPPERVWVKLYYLPQARYAEGDGGPPEGVAPVFVRIAMADPPDDNAIDGVVERLTRAIAETTARPAENIHLLFEASTRDRISFGGRIVRRL